MNDLLQLMHDTMGKTANIKGSVTLLKKDGISQADADKLLDIIEGQAKKLDEVIDVYYKANKASSDKMDWDEVFSKFPQKVGDIYYDIDTFKKFLKSHYVLPKESKEGSDYKMNNGLIGTEMSVSNNSCNECGKKLESGTLTKLNTMKTKKVTLDEIQALIDTLTQNPDRKVEVIRLWIKTYLSQPTPTSETLVKTRIEDVELSKLDINGIYLTNKGDFQIQTIKAGYPEITHIYLPSAPQLIDEKEVDEIRTPLNAPTWFMSKPPIVIDVQTANSTINIQKEVASILHQFGNTELGQYKIQLLFEKMLPSEDITPQVTLGKEEVTDEQIKRLLANFLVGNDVYRSEHCIKDFRKLFNSSALGKEEGKVPKEIIIGMNGAWSILDVLEKLISASNYLLHEKDYDRHDHEEIRICVKRAIEIIEEIKLKYTPSSEGKKESDAVEFAEWIFKEGWVYGQNNTSFGWAKKEDNPKIGRLLTTSIYSLFKKSLS